MLCGANELLNEYSQVALVVKNLCASVGDASRHGLDPWVGKMSGVGNDNLLLGSCLENSIDRGATELDTTEQQKIT